MKRLIVGLDLNGRLDFAARDRDEDGTGEAGRDIVVVAGGSFGSVVTAFEVPGQTKGHLVAGPQAALAPHGRGSGWGKIGSTDRRRSLAGALDSFGRRPDAAADIRAAVDALARGADQVVMAVPDLACFAEDSQGALIAAAKGRKRPVHLLWRSVAVFLDLLQSGRIGADQLEQSFRILIHSGTGIEEQVLTLRADRDHPRHRAPRRDGPGRLLAEATGLDALNALAQQVVHDENNTVEWERCEPSRLGSGLLMGTAAAGDVEVLRASNDTWLTIAAPELPACALGLAAVRVPASSSRVAATFLVTPLAPHLAEVLREAIQAGGDPVTLVGPETVARGCLQAGRLMERGLPHYFDRLEPVAIAVMRGQEPQFEHLIGHDAIVPANREYVSEEMSGFEWGRGKTDSEFYILKGQAEIRHWEISKAQGPTRNVPVALRIRQTPGQSWARLTISSADWEPLARSPVALDWEALTPSPLTPQEVLDKLRSPPPTIPDRIVEHPHVDIWMGSDWTGRGLASQYALQHSDGSSISASDWAAQLSAARRLPTPPRTRYWMVGTDGDLPEGLPDEVWAGFMEAIGQMEHEICAVTLRRPPSDNELLRALTWCFARCAAPVQDLILDALESHAAGQRHPLTEPSHSVRVLRQGAGRTITGEARLARLFRYLAASELNTDTINALAMALTRREEAPRALTRDQVDRFLNGLGVELLAQIKSSSFQIRFRNTLSAIAGLFRWRLQEPYALLASQDRVAERLRQTLLRAKDMLERERKPIPLKKQKIEQISAIVEYLDGGGDPDILRKIEEDE